MSENCQISCPGARCDRYPKRPPGSCNTPLGLAADRNGYYKVPDSAFYASTQLDAGGMIYLVTFLYMLVLETTVNI